MHQCGKADFHFIRKLRSIINYLKGVNENIFMSHSVYSFNSGHNIHFGENMGKKSCLFHKVKSNTGFISCERFYYFISNSFPGNNFKAIDIS